MSLFVRTTILLMLSCTTYTSLKAQLRGSIGKSEKLQFEMPQGKLPEATMVDEQLEELVRQACQPLKHGIALKVVLTDEEWHIKKTNAGIPERMYLGFQVLTEKDGQCYLLPGAIRKQYLGNDQFGSAEVSIIESVRDRTKMHCNNVE